MSRADEGGGRQVTELGRFEGGETSGVGLRVKEERWVGAGCGWREESEARWVELRVCEEEWVGEVGWTRVTRRGG